MDERADLYVIQSSKCSKCSLLLALSFIVGGLGGCASAGPQGAKAAAAPVPPDKARLYVYRELYLYDAQVWTAVSLNGDEIGDSAPGTVFYRDIVPGTYEIEVRSDLLYPDQFKTVALAAGSIAFAKIQEAKSWGKSWGRGGNTFVVTLIDPAVGYGEIARMRAQ